MGGDILPDFILKISMIEKNNLAGRYIIITALLLFPLYCFSWILTIFKEPDTECSIANKLFVRFAIVSLRESICVSTTYTNLINPILLEKYRWNKRWDHFFLLSIHIYPGLAKAVFYVKFAVLNLMIEFIFWVLLNVMDSYITDLLWSLYN